MAYQQLRGHIDKLLKDNVRFDGREPLQYREPITIEYNVIETAEGSAKVTIGDTIVIAGVKLELGTPFPDTPDQGALMVGAELLPLSNPEFESGPPGRQAIELSRVVDRGIRESGIIDLKTLCITEGEKVWTVLIDIVPINDAGNLFDAASLAAVAALKNTKLLAIVDNQIDYNQKSDKGLELKNVPLGITVLKIGNHFIVDPIIQEEKIYDNRLTIVTTEKGEICALQKGGKMPLTSEEISKMIDISIDKGNFLRSFLEK